MDRKTSRRSRWRMSAVGPAVMLVAVITMVPGVADPLDDALETVDETLCDGGPAEDLVCTGSGFQFFEARYNGPGLDTDTDIPWAITSANGVLFVTGQSEGSGTRSDFTTIAYDTGLGTQLWEARWDGADSDWDMASAIAYEADKVFVTGKSRTDTTWDDYATVAYDAITGDELWVATHNGASSLGDAATAIGTQDGTVFVTGRSNGNFGLAYATIAYDSETGEEMWTNRYDGPANGHDTATSLVVSGNTVVVTGSSGGVGTKSDYATVAYDSETGDELWASRYDSGFEETDNAHAIALSPSGDAVYVTGASAVDYACQNGVCGSFHDYATVAYDIKTGEESWIARYDGSDGLIDWANAVKAAEGLVFVTGFSVGNTGFGDNDFATLAYDAQTGDEVWEARFDGPAGDRSDVGYDVAVGLDKVFVTGSSLSEGLAGTDDYVTVAYDLTTGEEQWRERYDGAGEGQDTPRAITVEDNRIFVTGMSKGVATKFDYTTIGYVDMEFGLPLPE